MVDPWPKLVAGMLLTFDSIKAIQCSFFYMRRYDSN